MKQRVYIDTSVIGGCQDEEARLAKENMVVSSHSNMGLTTHTGEHSFMTDRRGQGG